MGDKMKNIENKIEQQKFLERLGAFCTDVFSQSQEKLQYKFSVDENDTVGEPSQLKVFIIFPGESAGDDYFNWSMNAYQYSEIRTLFNSLNILPKQSMPGAMAMISETIYDFKEIYESPKLHDILNNYDKEGLKNNEIQTFINNFKKINESVNFFQSKFLRGKNIFRDSNNNDDLFVTLSPFTISENLFSTGGLSFTLFHFIIFSPERINTFKNFLKEQGVDLNAIKNANDDGFDLPFSELSKLIPKFELAPSAPPPSVLFEYNPSAKNETHTHDKGDVKSRAESDKGDNKIQADAGEAPVNTDQRSEDKPRDNKPTGSI